MEFLSVCVVEAPTFEVWGHRVEPAAKLTNNCTNAAKFVFDTNGELFSALLALSGCQDSLEATINIYRTS